MNRTKTIASALLLMILPFAAPAFASDRDRGHEDEEYRHGHHGRHGHHRPHYRHHYYHHQDWHHNRHHGSYRHDYRGHDNRASVTLPFPPLPPFPVIVVKPHH